MSSYLTFSSSEAFSIKTNNSLKNWNGTLYYSTNAVKWIEWDGTVAISSAEHEGEHRIYMRGSGNKVITGSSLSTYCWVLEGTNIRCVGNIEYLLDYSTVVSGGHPTMGNYCFSRLFYGCTNLIQAPLLPATKLSTYCYYYMFYNTGLTEPVELPATKLVTYCYYRMFSNCAGIQLSTERTDYYSKKYRVPSSGVVASTTTYSVYYMFSSTGGAFAGTPTAGETYYYHPNEPIVTFQDWDGTIISQTQYAVGSKLVVPANPIQTPDGATNYVFREWTPAIQPIVSDSIAYTAVYEATTLPVRLIQFRNWDDGMIEARQLIDGEVINLPTNPERPDDADFRYTFSGWSPDVPATATADGIYTATYTSTPCYLIEFLDWDDSVISSQRYLLDSVITIPANPTRESDGAYNYEFDKWSPEVFGVAVAHATYRATYKSTKLPAFYDVTFVDWDGTILSTANYEAGATITIPPNPTRASDETYNYEFSGWSPRVVSYACATITYTATYRAIEIPVFYEIIFLDYDETVIAQMSVLKDTFFTIPADPESRLIDGYDYIFAGWTPTVKAVATDHVTYTATYDKVRVYSSVADIASGVSECEVLVNNSKNDDTTVTLTGVSWFSYGGKACANMYTSGNSWFGLTSGTSGNEDLKVNRRDGAMYYLYREEGMMHRYYKFLRFRFSGYGYYNTTSASAKITYDVIFWDTGDISLHMVNVPTSYYDGTFTLGTLSYTKPTASNPDVTFYLQDDGTYAVSYEPIVLEPPFAKKYLVKIYNSSGYLLYTVDKGVLSPLETKTLSAEVFREYGCDEVPDGSLLMPYSHFEVLYWFDTTEHTPDIQVAVWATPYPQTLESEDYDMTDSTIYGIEKVIVDATNSVSFAVSFDSGATWKAVKNGIWVALNQRESGMSAETIRLITTEQWNAVATTGKYRFRMTLADETSVFKSLVVDYLNAVEDDPIEE